MSQNIDLFEANTLVTDALAARGWEAQSDLDDERLDALTHDVVSAIDQRIDQFLASPDGGAEPPHGSVVMVHGPTGTAYQRHFGSGRWHATGDGGSPRSWEDVLALSSLPVIIIYRAPKEA